GPWGHKYYSLELIQNMLVAMRALLRSKVADTCVRAQEIKAKFHQLGLALTSFWFLVALPLGVASLASSADLDYLDILILIALASILGAASYALSFVIGRIAIFMQPRPRQ